jgi:hypothetical protein
MKILRIYRRENVLILLVLVCSAVAVSFTLASAAGVVKGWYQSGESGFGTVDNAHISALEVYEGDLYVGTWNNNGAQIWQSSDGVTWSELPAGWSQQANALNDFHAYKDKLYASFDNFTQGGELWRGDGSTWIPVVSQGFGDLNNYSVDALSDFQGELIAATGNFTNGVEIWSSPSGDVGSWIKVNESGFGQGGGTGNVVMQVYQGVLYVGLGRFPGTAELWSTDDLLSWTPVFTDGQGDVNNSAVTAMAEFKDEFYIGIRNTVSGGQLWRSVDGESWEQVFDDALGNSNNGRPYGLIEFNQQLYLVFSNFNDGAQVWRSGDGESWELILDGGWGTPANQFVDYFDRAAALFNNTLYIGTYNEETGGQVWFMELTSFLPMLLR